MLKWTKQSCIKEALKYKTRWAWGEGSSASYQAATIHNWKEECARHMDIIHKKWTKESCLKDSLKYKTKTEWSNNSSGYQASRKKGWLDQCTKHMEAANKPTGYWTKARCLETAKQFNTITEWSKAHSGANKAASQNGWKEECVEHMFFKFRPDEYWTLEKCKESARKYKTRTHWLKNESSPYNKARKKKWMDKCCGHMPPGKIPWTKSECILDAKKYQTKGAWKKASPSKYSLAWRRGWLKGCAEHMTTISLKWTFEKCLKEARRFKSKTSWIRNSRGGYKGAVVRGWLEPCSRHMKQDTKGRRRAIYWFIDDVKNYAYAGLTSRLKKRIAEHLKEKPELLKSLKSGNLIFGESGEYYSEKLAQQYENELIQYFTTKGYRILNKRAAGSLGRRVKYWTLERCKKDALNYETKNQWHENSSGCESARLNGFFDQCVGHMKVQFVWTRELCLAEANKYTRVKDWVKNAESSYQAARRKGWLIECKKHMLVCRESWTREK